MKVIHGVLLAALWASPAAAQDWQTVSKGREYNGEKVLRVDLEYGAGRLRIDPAASGTLYRASMRYDADLFEPRIQYADNELRVGFEGSDVKSRRKNMKGGSLNLQLGPQAPLDLDLAFGAVEAQLELGGLRITDLAVHTGASATVLRFGKPNLAVCESLEIEVGAAKLEAIGLGNLNARVIDVSGGVGEVTLDFTGKWQGNTTAKIQMGLGSLTIRVPKGLGVQVEKDGVLSGFDSQGLVKRGNVYYSEGYERAARKLEIQLEAAFGSIRVEWVE